MVHQWSPNGVYDIARHDVSAEKVNAVALGCALIDLDKTMTNEHYDSPVAIVYRSAAFATCAKFV